MTEIKYYHLRRNLSDEKPLDFMALENAYACMVDTFKDKAEIWRCDGTGDSSAPPPWEWIVAVIKEVGHVEIEIVTKDGEHFDYWLYEKTLRLMDIPNA